MAKLQDDPVGAADLIEYLDSSSDFAFELRCLELLKEMGFDCQHAGFYTDPVTKKTRQFDIRAERALHKWRVRCAIECKNLSDSFPLLVSYVPRCEDESFHDLVVAFPPDMVEQCCPRIPAFDKTCKSLRIDSRFSVYRPGDPVGKSCAQVGRTRDGTIVAPDSEVFERWSQALASAQDLADQATENGVNQRGAFLCLVLPVLVVPDGTLWDVRFDSQGSRTTDPVQTNRRSFYVGQLYAAGSMFQGTNITVSHVEFVTFSGLKSLMNEITCEAEDNCWFPPKQLLSGDTADGDYQPGK